MSIGVDLSVDPVESFLNGGGLEGYVEPENEEPHSRAGIVIAAGLLTAFGLMAAKLLDDGPAPPTPGAAVRRLEQAWEFVAPMWMRVVFPGVLHAFLLGSTRQMTMNETEFMAAQYAQALGDYANETSTQALVEGFQAQLNAGWDRDLAWRRAVQGYGLDSKGMRIYITPLLTRPTAFSLVEVPEASRQLVTTLLRRRAEKIGENEAYHATQLAKQLVWSMQQRQGLLPADAQKRWITADDERVCAVCGPLDGVAVPLADSFEVGGRRLIAPGVHPNCRCTIELTYAEVLHKAWQETKVKRDKEGQFSRTEQRVKVKDPELSADARLVADVLSRAVAAPAEDRGLTLVDDGLGLLLAPEDQGLTMVSEDRGLAASSLDEGMGLAAVAPEDTGFGEALRARSKSRKVVRIYWLPPVDDQPAQQMEEEVEEEFDDAPAWQLHQPPATMNAAEYYSAVLRTMQSKEGQKRFLGADESHPLLNPRVGTVIDFDATAQGTAQEGRWTPPAMSVVPNTDEYDVDLLGELAAWNQAKNSQGSGLAMRMMRETDEQMYAWEDEESSNMEHDLGERLGTLEGKELDAVAVRAKHRGGIVPPNWNLWDDSEKAAYIEDSWHAETDAEKHERDSYKGGVWSAQVYPWKAAMGDIAASRAIQYEVDSVVAANMMDSTADDIPPDLFVFDGHYGPAPKLVEGKYVVDRIDIKHLSLQQQEYMQELVDRDGLDEGAVFHEIRVLHLRPLEPAWMPQTPEELRRGLPPIDYEG